MPAARDGIRDGVIYIKNVGFKSPQKPAEIVEVPLTIDPETGEPLPIPAD
jgi:hypothetical protein